MELKLNEPFEPNLTSSPVPEGLIFRLAVEKDLDEITRLMHLRTPTVNFSKLTVQIDHEISFNKESRLYKIFVADLNKKVLGFCRFYHSSEVNIERRLFNAPEGYYFMGTIVDPEFRRKNISKFLSLGRFREIKKLGGPEVFSGVAGDNHASIQMHKKFGFKLVSKCEGFLQVKFDCGYGFLFKKDLKNCDNLDLATNPL